MVVTPTTVAKPAPVAAGCSTSDVGSMMLDPATWKVWEETVDASLAAAFQQPIGSGR
ncbi:hypothetical protein [Nocardia sp. NBC_00403]|uniref:hypothetical protein n=1 Tax=Nocardia sp. NBC_00403 TaxID=2975990 RepID=UPI002E1FBD0C